ncbi:uncharacterized protein [Drosophila pseudoobscura]|uniref:Uncharacterized protein n=1 Tax=Drosophila pseudoobscura pseudoobscura TaxID=46245 RepID=A0A6I8VPU7_DROPS|nr:uncharacterized protein LOC117183344 [Drosophila pseudoobscura]XP_033232888.1 uncharacterized protein LOC117183344 [Drosophila pseudoobscura]
MTGCSVFVSNGSEPQGALGVLSRAKKLHSCKMISECIADVEKVGLKAYRYFQPPTPEPPVIVVWTSHCAHWVGVLAGPIILALLFKLIYDTIQIRSATNVGVDPAEKSELAKGEGLVPAEQDIERPAAAGAARKKGGDAWYWDPLRGFNLR